MVVFLKKIRPPDRQHLLPVFIWGADPRNPHKKSAMDTLPDFAVGLPEVKVVMVKALY